MSSDNIPGNTLPFQRGCSPWHYDETTANVTLLDWSGTTT